MSDRESYDLGTPFLRLEREGHLAWCTIDRPSSRNALSAAMYFGIKRAVQIVNARNEPTALLITGVGDVFAPGGELRGQVEDPNPVLEQLGTDEILPFEAVRNSAAPVVSAVNGICQGGGLIVAMLSDVAVASERATFRAPELLRGIADTGYAAYPRRRSASPTRATCFSPAAVSTPRRRCAWGSWRASPRTRSCARKRSQRPRASSAPRPKRACT